MVTISGSVALVTGAGRGLGRVLTEALLERGAATVYGGARDPGTITAPGVAPVQLDITDPGQVAAAAMRCGDVTILINNAGIMRRVPLLAAPDTTAARAEMETNYFGTLAMCRAFAPVLAASGGGALVNVLSVVSWLAVPFQGSYAASKSAAWALTNAIRVELRHQGTQVTGVYASYIDTDMAAGANLPTISPQEAATQILDGIEAGTEEVLTDLRTRTVKAALPDDLAQLYPPLQQAWDASPPQTQG
jgi:NAD(P)-dependent dehydrogenase (short-subunit alcohol dehydrogenase family)